MLSRMLWSAVRAAALVCLLWPGTAAAQDVDELLGRGMQLHEAGDLLGAVQAYEVALQTDPSRADVRSNLGAAYVALGRMNDGIEQYRKALETSDLPSIRQNLALALYKSNRHAEAIPEFERVLQAEPANKPSALLLGDSLVAMGRYQQAVDLLTPREAAFSDDLGFAYVLGTALLQMGDVSKGQMIIDRIFSKGNSAEGHLLMGLALLAQRNYQAALTELQGAVDVNPELPTVFATLGRAQLGMGDREAAMRSFRRELERNPNSFEALLQLGTLYRIDQRYDDALLYLRRAEALQPQHAAVRHNIAATHLGLGDAERARELLESVVRDVPSYIDAHVLLATTYYRLKRKEDGDRERQVVEKLTADAQAKQPGAKLPAEGTPPAPPSPDRPEY